MEAAVEWCKSNKTDKSAAVNHYTGLWAVDEHTVHRDHANKFLRTSPVFLNCEKESPYTKALMNDKPLALIVVESNPNDVLGARRMTRLFFVGFMWPTAHCDAPVIPPGEACLGRVAETFKRVLFAASIFDMHSARPMLPRPVSVANPPLGTKTEDEPYIFCTDAPVPSTVSFHWLRTHVLERIRSLGKGKYEYVTPPWSVQHTACCFIAVCVARGNDQFTKQWFVESEMILEKNQHTNVSPVLIIEAKTRLEDFINAQDGATNTLPQSLVTIVTECIKTIQSIVSEKKERAARSDEKTYVNL